MVPRHRGSMFGGLAFLRCRSDGMELAFTLTPGLCSEYIYGFRSVLKTHLFAAQRTIRALEALSLCDALYKSTTSTTIYYYYHHWNSSSVTTWSPYPRSWSTACQCQLPVCLIYLLLLIPLTIPFCWSASLSGLEFMVLYLLGLDLILMTGYSVWNFLVNFHSLTTVATVYLKALF